MELAGIVWWAVQVCLGIYAGGLLMQFVSMALWPDVKLWMDEDSAEAWERARLEADR